MFAEGRLLLERVRASLGRTATPDTRVVDAAIDATTDTTRPVPARLAVLQADDLAAVFARHPLRDLVSVEGPFPAYADRPRALFGSWYEFFPRSEGATKDPVTGKVTPGTLRTAAERLDAVAAMGFDIIYLPPIHPIGRDNRKGPNNTLTPGPDDTGSPWAIGAREGGHDAIHPDLGTMKDFDAFVARANELGLEVALDFALQAAPDHPWVTKHPEWFTTRADGSIAYAENPPKKYQDIYPINFDNDPDGDLQGDPAGPQALDEARRPGLPRRQPAHQAGGVLGVAARRGPQDRPRRDLPVRGVHPPGDDARPRRGGLPPELHLLHLAHRQAGARGLPPRGVQRVRPPDAAELLREHPRHPARLPAVRRPGGVQGPRRAGGHRQPELGRVRRLRALRARGDPPGPEEYLDSEKYQIRIRDWDAAEAEGRTLAPYITRLNELRRAHPALQLLRNVTVHRSDDDSILVFSKHAVDADGHEDVVIVVVNVDPHATRETMVHLDMPALGLDWNDSFLVHEELTGQTWNWTEHSYVRLDPGHEPAHILTIRRPR